MHYLLNSVQIYFCFCFGSLCVHGAGGVRVWVCVVRGFSPFLFLFGGELFHCVLKEKGFKQPK